MAPPLDEQLVEMSNGCICRTLREDLLVQVAELARDGRFDYLLIESTGISEPLPVAVTFAFENVEGVSLAATRPAVCGTWSQAGPWLRLEPAGWWLAATPRVKWDLDAEEERSLTRIWDDDVGDRRQELVFVGQGLDPDAVRTVLDPALLDETEFAAGPAAWRALPDPLPAWQVDDDGYVHDHDHARS